MKVEITAVPELECAEAKAEGRALNVTPIFWSPKEVANAASIVITSNAGKVLFRGLIRVSGQSGRPAIVERTVPVMPAVDKGASVKK